MAVGGKGLTLFDPPLVRHMRSGKETDLAIVARGVAHMPIALATFERGMVRSLGR